jgi:hypothetical protein
MPSQVPGLRVSEEDPSGMGLPSVKDLQGAAKDLQRKGAVQPLSSDVIERNEGLTGDTDTAIPYPVRILWKACEKVYFVVLRDLILSTPHIYGAITLTFYGIKYLSNPYSNYPLEPFDSATWVGIASIAFYIVNPLLTQIADERRISPLWKKTLDWVKDDAGEWNGAAGYLFCGAL